MLQMAKAEVTKESATLNLNTLYDNALSTSIYVLYNYDLYQGHCLLTPSIMEQGKVLIPMKQNGTIKAA